MMDDTPSAPWGLILLGAGTLGVALWLAKGDQGAYTPNRGSAHGGRPLVRVSLPGETSWAEHVRGDVYRSLNDTYSNVRSKSGRPRRLMWGHLFRAKRRGHQVKPIAIVGMDKTPRKDLERRSR